MTYFIELSDHYLSSARAISVQLSVNRQHIDDFLTYCRVDSIPTESEGDIFLLLSCPRQLSLLIGWTFTKGVLQLERSFTLGDVPVRVLCSSEGRSFLPALDKLSVIFSVISPANLSKHKRLYLPLWTSFSTERTPVYLRRIEHVYQPCVRTHSN